MNSSDELRMEIDRWSKKLDEKLMKVSSTDHRGKKMLENVHAYRKDSQHFLGKGDLVRSFECLIWAWAYLEIGLELGHLSVKN